MSKRSPSNPDEPKRKRRPRTAEQLERRRRWIQADLVKKLVQYGAGPEIIYAFKTTGLLILPQRIEYYPPADVVTWLQAIAEYRRLAAEGSEQPRN